MDSCSALSFTMFASSAARLLRRGRQIGFVMAACCLLQECVDKTTVCDSCDMCQHTCACGDRFSNFFSSMKQLEGP